MYLVWLSYICHIPVHLIRLVSVKIPFQWIRSVHPHYHPMCPVVIQDKRLSCKPQLDRYPWSLKVMNVWEMLGQLKVTTYSYKTTIIITLRFSLIYKLFNVHPQYPACSWTVRVKCRDEEILALSMKL